MDLPTLHGPKPKSLEQLHTMRLNVTMVSDPFSSVTRDGLLTSLTATRIILLDCMPAPGKGQTIFD
jgi:hypothetical protein